MHKSPEWLGYIEKAADSGAGEIVVQSVDRDGTMSGLDLELISMVGRSVDATIAAGGVGSLEDIRADQGRRECDRGGQFLRFSRAAKGCAHHVSSLRRMEALVGPSENARC